MLWGGTHGFLISNNSSRDKTHTQKQKWKIEKREGKGKNIESSDWNSSKQTTKKLKKNWGLEQKERRRWGWIVVWYDDFGKKNWSIFVWVWVIECVRGNEVNGIDSQMKQKHQKEKIVVPHEIKQKQPMSDMKERKRGAYDFSNITISVQTHIRRTKNEREEETTTQ